MKTLRNKYHAKRTPYGGIWYDSKKEAAYAAQLDMLHNAVDPSERVIKVQRQPEFELSPKPNRIVYRADFRVTYGDGHEEIVDVKGIQTREFRLKLKLFNQKYPDLVIKIV